MEIAPAEDDPIVREQLLEQLLVQLKEPFDGFGYCRDHMDMWQKNLPEKEFREVFLGNALRYGKNWLFCDIENDRTINVGDECCRKQHLSCICHFIMT